MKKSYYFISAATILMALPAIASAEDLRSSFARDRNVSVTQKNAVENAPLGINGNGFVYYPSVSLTGTYNDNIYYTDASKKSDFIINLAPALTARSNWNRNALGFNARVAQNQYTSHNDESFTDVAIGADGRIDTVGLSNLYGSVGYQNTAESRGEPSNTSVAKKPIKYDLTGAKLGYIYEANRLRGTVGVDYKDYNYHDATSIAGANIDEDFRDRKETSYTIKGEYAVSPAMSVFASVVPNQIKFDSAKNSDSKGYNVNVGTSFDVSSLARGEIAVGSYHQNFDNSAYKDQNGVNVEGSLEWFPTQMTTISFGASNKLGVSPLPTSPSYKVTNLSASLDHELYKNLILSTGIAYNQNDYNEIDRNDKITNYNIGAKYNLNRKAALVTSYNYSKLDSSGVNKGTNYTNNGVKVGINFAY